MTQTENDKFMRGYVDRERDLVGTVDVVGYKKCERNTKKRLIKVVKALPLFEVTQLLTIALVFEADIEYNRQKVREEYAEMEVVTSANR